jgi:hypothetical protein
MDTPFSARSGIPTYNNDCKITKIVALNDKKKKRTNNLSQSAKSKGKHGLSVDSEFSQ